MKASEILHHTELETAFKEFHEEVAAAELKLKNAIGLINLETGINASFDATRITRQQILG